MEGKPKQILIADDEQDILEIISYNLTKEGYEVYTAKDGNEAIEKAKQIHPDLIILDIMMPKKTGVEVCQILRSQPLSFSSPHSVMKPLKLRDWKQVLMIM
jgi:two-component system, OmpR family, alkaline phosphatase synthesis response regulator PhoP